MKYVFVAAAAALAAGPAVSQATPDACALAASEPTLIWYSSQDPSRNRAVADAFGAVYPSITLEHFRLATGALATRYAQERAAGVINADVISLADPNFIVQGAQGGWFIPLTTNSIPELSGLDSSWLQDGAITSSISMLGFAYNVDEVGDAPPQSWQDLLDPKYAGRMIMGDPRTIPSYMALFRILREELGEDFLTKLAAQKPVIVPSVVPATQQLAAGEVSIVFPNVMTVVRVLRDEGAPIDFIAPELTTGNEFQTVVSAGADSPNAAMCFVSFLMSEAGQVAYNGPTSVSPFPGIPETAVMPTSYIAPRILELDAHSAMIVRELGLE
jgi:iron(III) transport system substrate-binding protein